MASQISRTLIRGDRTDSDGYTGALHDACSREADEKWWTIQKDDGGIRFAGQQPPAFSLLPSSFLNPFNALLLHLEFRTLPCSRSHAGAALDVLAPPNSTPMLMGSSSLRR